MYMKKIEYNALSDVIKVTTCYTTQTHRYTQIHTDTDTDTDTHKHTHFSNIPYLQDMLEFLTRLEKYKNKTKKRQYKYAAT